MTSIDSIPDCVNVVKHPQGPLFDNALNFLSQV